MADYLQWATHSHRLPRHDAERRPWRRFEIVVMAVAQAGQQMDHQDLAGLSLSEGEVHINEVNQEHDIVQEQRPQIGQRHRGRMACSLGGAGAGQWR